MPPSGVYFLTLVLIPRTLQKDLNGRQFSCLSKISLLQGWIFLGPSNFPDVRGFPLSPLTSGPCFSPHFPSLWSAGLEWRGPWRLPATARPSDGTSHHLPGNSVFPLTLSILTLSDTLADRNHCSLGKGRDINIPLVTPPLSLHNGWNGPFHPCDGSTPGPP